MPTWDANLYLRFADLRTQPAIDLVGRIALERPRRIIDLGCGPGNSTEVLRRRWPEAEITGLDQSAEMIATARRTHPQGLWVSGDIATWSEAGAYDVVFSNAALQWVPDHRTRFPELFRGVAPGGVLAVQMPSHLQSPLHRRMVEISQRPEWHERLAGARSALETESAAFYCDLLQPLAARIDLWETTYYHVMNGPEVIIDWIRGSGLRPFLEALADEPERQRFQELLLQGVAEDYPRQRSGCVLFPFHRLFLLAYRDTVPSA